ncbi:MAG: AEC family transporter [Opitutae bacterium]|nr:AEC family transporter [Opitutae bacterium]
MHVLTIVLPVFAVILLGILLARFRFLSAPLIAELNRLTYFVGLPAYLFSSLAGVAFGGGRAALVFGVMAAATLVTLALGYGVARVRGLGPESIGTFLHAAIRGNLAFVGLPVVSLALVAHGGPNTETLHQVALIAMAPLVVITNTLGVLLLLVGRGTTRAAVLRSIGWQLATNPLLLATGVAVACAGVGLRLPGWLAQSVGIVGQMALPLALLCIGGTLMVTPLRGKRTAAVLASALKIAVLPLVAWPICRWAGLSPDETRIALLFLACPTAAASFTLAGKLGGDEALAASSVVLSTALSVLSLSAVLALV